MAGAWTVAAALALAVAQAGAEPPGTRTEPPSTVEEVVVTSASAKAISEFVRAVAEPTKEGRLARWNRKICPATIGLTRKYGEYLNERLAQVARSVDLKVDKPGCRPDILIVVTGDVDRLMAELALAHKAAFATRSWNERTSGGGAETFSQFIETPRPVRWWHVSETVAADGRPLGRVGKVGDMHVDAVRVDVTSPSRLSSTMREDFAGVIVVVDAKMAQGVSYDALSSYVAMVSLAQLDPNAETGQAPTILNLFRERAAGRPGPSELTGWDQAYLRGLYGARADAPNLRSQRGSIIRSLKKEAPEPKTDRGSR